MRRAGRPLPAGLRAADRELRAGAHDRLRVQRGLDPAHRGGAVHPHRLDPAGAARQHRPPGRRHPGAAGARLDPGLHRHPHPVRPAARLHPDAARARQPGPGQLRGGGGGDEGLLGEHARLHGEPAEGLVGRGRHGGQRLLLRLPAPAHRQPQHLRDGDGPARRGLPRLLPVRREPGRGVGEHQDAAARHGEAGLAGRAGLLAHRERHLVEGRPGDRDRGAAHRRTSAPRCSSCPPPRTPRRTAASPTPSGCCSGITRRSSPAATPAATCGSPTTSAAGSGRSWPARPTRWTGRCWT